MARPLNPIIIWKFGYRSDVTLDDGAITIHHPGDVTYDSDADIVYRSLLAARRARRSGHLDLPKS